MIRAHRLAHELEVQRAKAEAKWDRMRRDWLHFYDPHAATELGNLIYNRMFPGPTTR